jgi:hypothetical protein
VKEAPDFIRREFVVEKYDLSTPDGLMESIKDDIENYKPKTTIALRDPRTELFQYVFHKYETSIGGFDVAFLKIKIWEAISKYSPP